MVATELLLVLRIAHVLCAALWFGAEMLWHSLLWEVPQRDSPEAVGERLGPLLGPSTKMLEGAEVATIVSGLLLLSVIGVGPGWFSTPRGLRFLGAMALAVGAFLLGLVSERALGTALLTGVGRPIVPLAERVQRLRLGRRLVSLELLLLTCVLLLMVLQTAGY